VNDRELLAELVPRYGEIERPLCGGWRTARGSGYRLLQEVGAEFAALDRVWMYPVGTPNPRAPRQGRGLVVRGIEHEIWVDVEGRRFHDESLRGGRSGTAALIARPGQTCWGVFDAMEGRKLRLLDDERYGSALSSTADQQRSFFAESQHAWQAPTLAALAQEAGLPVDALSAAVRSYNAAISAGGRDPFGRDLSRARPIDEHEVCAIQYFPIVQKNLGGVVTSTSGGVLGAAGQPIAGLRAAGEVAGMAGGHINGEAALGPALLSGRIAGRAAAAGSRR